MTDHQTAATDSTVREVTASTFLLRRDAGHWSVGLIWHDRLGSHMPAGHGELAEGVHDAAVREVLEETGLRARLIPGPTAPTPAGFPHRPVPAPWWICEGGASPDGHTSTPHTHVDHIYLALVDIASAATEQQADHQLTWFTHSRLSSEPTVSEDSRLLALQLMTWLDGAPAGAEDDPVQLSAHLAHQATLGLLPAQHSQKEESA